jgi:hypothetical protein
MTRDLRDVLTRLEEYIWNERFRGYDPYDLLTSPIFRSPILKANKTIRFYSQQIFRRIPFNLRGVMQIRKGYNPVTLGVVQLAYLLMSESFPKRRAVFLERSRLCIDELIRLQSKNYSGACWGYDFDWEGRYARIPAFTPTVVATGFITNCLFERYRMLKDEISRSLLESSARFVLYDLQRTTTAAGICFSYSPNDRQQVLNASLKGARLLSQVYALTGVSEYRETAQAAVQFAASCQRPDGSFPYSIGDARHWSDNYHTAYVLDCMKSYGELTNDLQFEQHLARGIEYYKQHFFTSESIPKYYDTRVYPIDATCAAQSIITLTLFGEREFAQRVTQWTINNLFDEEGFVHYQRLRWYTHRTSYMRWSNAWMLLALAYYLAKGTTNDKV